MFLTEPELAAGMLKEPELDDRMLLRLSDKVVDMGDLRNLAIKGLDVSLRTAARHIQDSRTIDEAAFNLLQEWTFQQENRVIAYDKLCKALERAGQEFLIDEVLI